ncbi:MAG: UDP-N-acetylmuramoyl-L-alanyl-D-glutamate--2,6-diaminopimelate ligase, partial [Planctomycetota bacterium]|nr:UDP-N-acetylmuramoyl-L-alanyl-D-glutamate--2,6-diaminopimelate ligase [Planctomycetota bacterium]
DARARGAGVVVADRALPGAGPVLVVADVAAALRATADAWFDRPQAGLGLLAVTGTKGKTTVAWLAAAALRAAGHKPALFGTIEHDLGAAGREPSANTTPGALELRRLLAKARAGSCDSAVLEVSSHALDQGRTTGLEFAAAALTNLASDHLDYHGDPQSYFEAKARLFDELGTDGLAILNREDAAWSRFAARVRGSVLTYGFSPEADLRAEDVHLASDGTRFRLVVAGGGTCEIATPLVGKHNVLNLLAAVGLCVGLGVDPLRAAEGAASVALVPGRLERVASDADVRAFVDYAHTEDALRQVLTFLRMVKAVPITCVIGCGGDRDRSKRPRMARVAFDLSDRVVFTSDNPRGEEPQAILADMLAGLSAEEREQAHVIVDRAAAIGQAVREAPAGATVLVAGKGHETYQILGTERLPFDDAAVVRSALALRPGRAAGGPAPWGASQAY